MKINGHTVDSKISLSAISSYVQQEDLFVGTLTVKEHLVFQVVILLNRL